MYVASRQCSAGGRNGVSSTTPSSDELRRYTVGVSCRSAALRLGPSPYASSSKRTTYSRTCFPTTLALGGALLHEGVPPRFVQSCPMSLSDARGFSPFLNAFWAVYMLVLLSSISFYPLLECRPSICGSGPALWALPATLSYLSTSEPNVFILGLGGFKALHILRQDKTLDIRVLFTRIT